MERLLAQECIPAKLTFQVAETFSVQNLFEIKVPAACLLKREPTHLVTTPLPVSRFP